MPRSRRARALALLLLLALAPGLYGVGLGLWPVPRGVNDAGGEFLDVFPPPPGLPIGFSSPRTLDYVAGKGLRLVRLPFAWEQVQPEPGGPLNREAVGSLRRYLEEADRRGLQVIPDLHNYARFTKVDREGRHVPLLVGSKAFPERLLADFWRRLVEELKDAPAIYAWGIMNEPHDIVTKQWERASQAVVEAIRSTGDRHWILVPGSNWSSAHIWVACHGRHAWIRDPLGRTAYEAHTYFYRRGSSGYLDSYDEEAAADPELETRSEERVQVFIDWCESNGVPGFVGEFGCPDDPRWLRHLDRVLARMDRHHMPGTAWALGEKWPRDYPLNMHPDPETGRDQPQMEVLLRHPGGRTSTVASDFAWGYERLWKRTMLILRPLRDRLSALKRTLVEAWRGPSPSGTASPRP